MSNKKVRAHLVALLKGGNAFVPLEKALKDIPFEKAGIVPDGLPYSIWQQVEHLRRAQKDIIDFTKNENYQKLKWPDEYWPQNVSPETKKQWEETLKANIKYVDEMIQLVEDEDRELLEPFEHGNGQTLFREAVLLAEHNAYHIGQILIIRRILNIW